MSARLWLVCVFSSELAAAPGACQPCHASIDASYATSGMARTFSTEIGAVGDWDRRNTFYHKASDRWYRLFRKDGAYFVRRWQKGYRGVETNAFETRIDYAVGSGAHARSFLYQARDGRLFELPVSWYAGESGHWAMSPGFDRAGHSDFRREVSPACLFCHAAYDSRSGVDCERCHGPGASHAAQPSRERIVNPARLPAARAEEVCLQCHLQTTSRALPDAIRLTERYVPGSPLAQHRLVFDHAPGLGMDDKFEVNSAAYRLRRSACKNLTCTNCHDPHHQRKVDVTAACRGCHESAHTRREAGCAGCHMPRQAADDAPDVTLTDHKIQRQTAQRRPAPEIYRGPVAPYFPPSPDPLWLAIAQVRDGTNLDAGIKMLEPFAKSGDKRTANELAEAYRKAGRHREAAEWFRRTGDHGRLGEMLLRVGDPAAWEALNTGIAQNPRDVDTLLAIGVAAGQRGQLAASIDWFRRATEIRPELPLAWLNLGVSLEQSGDVARAEAAYREAIRWQPDFAAAHDHLGNLLAAKGDVEQARYERSLAARLKADGSKAR